MITYNKQFPENSNNDIFAGVLGDNNSTTKVFFIKNITDENFSFIIRLRFKDGKFNSVIPSRVSVNSEGTYLYWCIKKEDIFCSGSFELQIEASNEDYIMQTQTIRLFADESLAIGNAEYENPNSATIEIRNQIIELLAEINNQNNQISQNLEIINGFDLDKKENTQNKVSQTSQIANPTEQYPTVEFLTNYYYNAEKTEQELAKKVDTSNVYSKSEAESTFLKNENGSVSSSNISRGAVTSIKIADNAVSTSNIADNSITKAKFQSQLLQEFNNKANKSNTLGEYGITNAYTISQIDSLLNEKENRISPNLFDKRKITQGFKFDDNGNIIANQDYFISDLIKLNNKEKLIFTINDINTISLEIQFFDLSQRPVWNYPDEKSLEITYDNQRNQFFVVPSNAYFVRFSMPNTFLESNIMLADKILPYVGFSEFVDSSLTIPKMPADAQIVGNILESKYNANNVETGEGEFNIATSSLAQSGSFKYTKIDDIVILYVELTVKPRGDGLTVANFSNPPFCISSSAYIRIAEERRASKVSECWSANETTVRVSVSTAVTEVSKLVGVMIYKTN